jgi:hypothetical protein
MPASVALMLTSSIGCFERRLSTGSIRRARDSLVRLPTRALDHEAMALAKP